MTTGLTTLGTIEPVNFPVNHYLISTSKTLVTGPRIRCFTYRKRQQAARFIMLEGQVRHGETWEM